MKKPDFTPFDRMQEPPRQNTFLLPLIWLVSWLETRQGHLQIKRIRMEGLKPPFLVLGTHHAFMDFYVTPLALFPYRANYVSELEGFEHYGEWAYRQIGCLGTRKFVNDLSLVRNIQRVIARGDILVLYPEARYANVGTSSLLPSSIGKLAKLLKVPVVTLNMRGNYLQSPIWNLRRRRGSRLEATITQLFTCEELTTATAGEVQTKIQNALTYDEYAWQYETKQVICSPWRAEGLEHPLYQCIQCGQIGYMTTSGAELFCKACGSRWFMTELGRLEEVERPGASVHIPDWYEWERRQVEEEIELGRYGLELPVQVEALPNAVNFIDLGVGFLRHNNEGFFLRFADKTERALHISPQATFSVHTEYDYRNKGECITLSVPDNTYFLYPRGDGFYATKIQFATEYLYQKNRTRKGTLNAGPQ